MELGNRTEHRQELRGDKQPYCHLYFMINWFAHGDLFTEHSTRHNQTQLDLLPRSINFLDSSPDRRRRRHRRLTRSESAIMISTSKGDATRLQANDWPSLELDKELSLEASKLAGESNSKQLHVTNQVDCGRASRAIEPKSSSSRQRSSASMTLAT